MFGKLFASMYDGTLATRGPWQALVTFQQFLVLSDRKGIVDMTADALARRTTIPIEILHVGISALEQPDTESRTPDQEGRRITRLSPDRSWGWQIVNYEKYRKIRSEDERRDYMAELMRQRRLDGKVKPKKNKLALAKLAHADAEADVKEVQPAPPLASPPVVQGVGGEDREPQVQDIKSATRAAYERAYIHRWGARPLWDAKANSLIVNIVKRLGRVAPAVAAFYLGSNRGLYVSAKHDLTLLLRDANGLHTEWATGTRVSDTEARQGDKTAGNANAFLPLIEAARRQEGER